jgi:hypothetical protein
MCSFGDALTPARAVLVIAAASASPPNPMNSSRYYAS